MCLKQRVIIIRLIMGIGGAKVNDGHSTLDRLSMLS